MCHRDTWATNIELIYSHFGVKFEHITRATHPGSTIFPRDMAGTIGGKIFVAPEVKIKSPSSSIVQSIFGEEGRILHAGKTIIVPERIFETNGRARTVSETELEQLRDLGLTIMQFPLTGIISNSFGPLERAYNDHLDRVGCLLLGTDGKPHLFVDNQLSVKIYDRHDRGTELGYSDSHFYLHGKCRRAGIELHRAPPPRVPYSLNMVQAPTGKVLMTSGDLELTKLIESIVGNGNVVTTHHPIRYYPSWFFGGIRCMIADVPTLNF